MASRLSGVGRREQSTPTEEERRLGEAPTTSEETTHPLQGIALRPSQPNQTSLLGDLEEPVGTPQERLEQAKAQITKYLSFGDAIGFAIAKYAQYIEREKLYRYEVDQSTGETFTRMKDYLPVLLEELRNRARLHKLSVRQVREYIALHKVFVENLGISTDEIMEIGPSHFTEIREAVDYDRSTGAVKSDAEAKEGKLGAESALRMVEELREAPPGEVNVRHVQQALDEQRGVVRKMVSAEWRKTARNDGFVLMGLFYIENGVRTPIINGTGRAIPIEAAQFLDRKLGGLSNLGELLDEE
jgi:hypothetical protein